MSALAFLSAASAAVDSRAVPGQWLSGSSAPWATSSSRAFPLRRVLPMRRRAPARAQLATPGLTAVALREDEAVRETFAKAVLGEWAGFEAEFDVETGAPRVIPSSYIPDEFAQWGMQPLGFQTVHSVILRGTALYHKHFRILPNVTHFGDHVDLEENLTLYQVADDPGFLAFPDGSFSAGSAKVLVKRSSILDKVPSAYLVLRQGGTAVHADVKFDFEKCELIDCFRVVKEEYSCTHCDGGDIDGSSGYMEGWCSDPALQPADLAGEWTSTGHSSTISRPDGGPPHEPKKQLYLPHGIDISVNATPENGLALQVGWLVEPSKRLVLGRCYSPDGSLVTSTIVVETRLE